jgi:hypothetical protein
MLCSIERVGGYFSQACRVTSNLSTSLLVRDNIWPMLVQFYVRIEKERDTGFQQFAYTSVLRSFVSLACRNLPLFNFGWSAKCTLIAIRGSFVSQLGSWHRRRKRCQTQVKLVEREDEVWQASKAWRQRAPILLIWCHVLKKTLWRWG